MKLNGLQLSIFFIIFMTITALSFIWLGWYLDGTYKVENIEYSYYTGNVYTKIDGIFSRIAFPYISTCLGVLLIEFLVYIYLMEKLRNGN